MSTGRRPDPCGTDSPAMTSNVSALPTDTQDPLTGKVTRTPAKQSETNSEVDLAKTLLLIESVAKAKDQNQALVSIVIQAAVQFPGSNVRCGIGTTRLRRYYDHRLGWLSPTSDLFQDAATNWDDDSATLPTRPSLPLEYHQQSTSAADDLIRLNIDDDVGLGRCVLWINDGDLTANDRIWLRRALPSLRAILWRRGNVFAQLTRSMASGGTVTRVYLGLASLFLFLLVVWPVSYRVRCTTLVRPDHARIIAAPFDATLEATEVRPGDSVKIGDVLIKLDGRPLRLELETVEAKIGRVQKERDIAKFGGRVADSQLAKLRIRELSRHRDLLLSRLRRLTVTSPIDGVVVLGDLNRSIGAPLKMGQSVMEIAPMDRMVIELEIPEYEIGYVSVGTIARVRLNAGDGTAIEQPIDGVYPSAELRDDQNVFVARINVDNSDRKLRPGMRGEAIAYGPIRPWLWSWARSGWEKTLWWIGY